MSRRGIANGEDDGDDEKPSRLSCYTGEQIPAWKRDKILELLAVGTPVRHIIKALKCDYYTVTALELSRVPEIEQRRQAAADEAYMALRVSTQSVIDRARKGLATGVEMKMASDVWRDLTQQAGAPINVVHHFPALEEFERLGGGDDGKVIEQAE